MLTNRKSALECNKCLGTRMLKQRQRNPPEMPRLSVRMTPCACQEGVIPLVRIGVLYYLVDIMTYHIAINSAVI